MKPFKIALSLLSILFLTSCSEVASCQNPGLVNFVERLPCHNCQYRGTVHPNICPNETYPHKLRCLAQGLGANVVLVNQPGQPHAGFKVYDCPDVIRQPPSNARTDYSKSCDCIR